MESIRVGSAVVVENERGEILLARSNKPPVEGKWVLPGGGINFGETSRQAAQREIKEETGLEIEVGDFITAYELIVPNENIHRLILYHKAKAVGGKLKASDDISELVWMKPNDIRQLKNATKVVFDILEKAKYD